MLNRIRLVYVVHRMVVTEPPMSRIGSVAVPKLEFSWVSRADVARTRPALERAGYRCEHCRRDDGLRVVEGYGQLVVLCPECVLGGIGFKMVLVHRKNSRQGEHDGRQP